MGKLSVRALTPCFGVEVLGVDIATGIDDQVFAQLADIYVERKVVLLRNQQLSPQELVDFAWRWGEPRNDAFTELEVPGFKDLSRVGNTEGLLEQEHYRNGSCYWHTDCAAEPDPNATTMLYCLHAPASGGETQVADLQAAYDALDGDTKSEINERVARHAYSGTCDSLDGRESWEIPFPEKPVSDDTVSRLPPNKQHPLVRVHSISGRKGLYAPAGSVVGIEGLDDPSAHQLLRRLKLHAVRDDFCYKHQYRPGDLLMWDNSATLHRSSYIDAPRDVHDRRLLYRIVPTGLPKPLRDSGG